MFHLKVSWKIACYVSRIVFICLTALHFLLKPSEKGFIVLPCKAAITEISKTVPGRECDTVTRGKLSQGMRRSMQAHKYGND